MLFQNVNLIAVVSDRILYHNRNSYRIITNRAHLRMCNASTPISALVCCMLQAEYEIQNVVVLNVYTFIKSIQTFTMEFNSSLTYHNTQNGIRDFFS
jgi:hypothetical protein